MKFRRVLFISSLLVLFLVCYHIMNQRYDKLSRYQYADDKNRNLILEYLSDEDINYLIDRQYQPSEFLGYLGIEEFQIQYVDWYNYAKKTEKISDKKIIQLVNTMSQSMVYSQFVSYCDNYSTSKLYSFYFEENSFTEGLNLISNPSSIKDHIDSDQTIFTYEPANLVEISDVAVVNQNKGKDKILLVEESAIQLSAMCKAAFDINEKTCGNMVVIEGYVSFDEQEVRYENAILKYGADDALLYEAFPGQSIFQLGIVVKLLPAAVDIIKTQENEISLQQAWLMEHAKEYGFEFVNDPNNILDEFILRYQGIQTTMSE
ncbi:MAG: D-alanyl-D-alanine carboxypeptidase family protein [Traorella sp.]